MTETITENPTDIIDALDNLIALIKARKKSEGQE